VRGGAGAGIIVHVKRRLFTAPVVSLLLCLVTVAMWARSYWVADSFTIATLVTRTDGSHGAFTIYFFFGGCGAGFDEWMGPGLFEHHTTQAPPGAYAVASLHWWNWVGLVSNAGLMTPLWVPAAIFAVMPVRSLIRTLRSRNARLTGSLREQRRIRVVRGLFVLTSLLSLVVCVATLILQFHGYQTVGESLGLYHTGLQDLYHPESPYAYTWWSAFPLFPVTVFCIVPPLFATRSVARMLRARLRPAHGPA